jgi:hypothetical protein
LLNSIRRFFNLQPKPDGASSSRRWLALAGAGFVGLLIGAGIGAAGKEKTTTVTVAGGVTTVRARTRPARTVTQTVVHVHVHTHVVTQTVTQTTTAPSAAGSGSSPGEEDEVGSTSHAGDATFCEEHHCIGEFESEDGTVVECSDGTYSHAGGIPGACSYHGGEASGSGNEEREEEHE